MKPLFFSIFLCFFFSSSVAQLQENKQGKMYFKKVYEVPGHSQSEIKNAVNEWIAINFNDANQVIKLNTEEKIINKGLIKSTYEWEGYKIDLTTEFDMISEFKDEKYRLTLDNIQYKTSETNFNPLDFNQEEISKEEWADIIKKQIEEMPNGPTRKYNQKMLDNPKKFDEFYEVGMKARAAIYNSIVPEIEGIGESLNSYLSKNSSEDNW